MLELLNVTTRKGIFVPDSGPGPKYIQNGNTDFGYMGEVSDAELGIIDTLTKIAMDNNGVAKGEWGSRKWVKYIRKNRVIYFPLWQFPALTPIALNNIQATWNYRDKGTAQVPTTLANGKPMYDSNLMVVAKDQSVLAVRLLSASDTTWNIANTANIGSSEYYDIVTSVYDPDSPNVIGYKRNINEILFPMAVDGPRGATYVQQLQTGSPTSTMFGAWSGATSLRNLSASPTTNSMRWTPILEYLPESESTKFAYPIDPVKLESLATLDQPTLVTEAEWIMKMPYLHGPGYVAPVPQTDSLEYPAPKLSSGSSGRMASTMRVGPGPARLIATAEPFAQIAARNVKT